MISDREIIEQLFHYGHFRGRVTHNALPALTLRDREVIEALRSYQSLMSYSLSPLMEKHHGRALVADGDAGPATRELFTLPRCAVPDYGPESVAGDGSWPDSCAKSGVKFHVAKAGMPSAIVSRWPEIQAQVVRAYALVGLKLVEVQSAADANIQTYFGSFLFGTIGLAQFNSESCSSRVTCKLSNRYVGHNAGLLKHEWGHNCNLSHTRGGTMNPSMIPEINADASWAKSDPSYMTLVRYFGGVPIDSPPPPSQPLDPSPANWLYEFLKLLFPAIFK